jgi:hypothetical protein
MHENIRSSDRASAHQGYFRMIVNPLQSASGTTWTPLITVITDPIAALAMQGLHCLSTKAIATAVPKGQNNVGHSDRCSLILDAVCIAY